MSHLALGDFVYHGALLKALKKAYPNLEIDIWMDDCRDKKKKWHSERSSTLTSWVSKTDIADVIFPIAKDDSDRDMLVRRASRRNYDIIFYLASVRVERFAYIARLISSKAILMGNSPIGLVNKVKSVHYLRHVKRRFDLNLHDSSTHIFEKYKRYYERCFGPLTIAESDNYGVGITLPDESVMAVNQWCMNEQRERFSPFVMINPISTSHRRDLNGDTLKHLIVHLLENYPSIHLVVNVPPSSQVGMKALLSHNMNTVTPAQKISIFSAEDDFYTLPALMKKCDFIVTVETSVMHIAAVLNIPQLAIVRKKAKKWRPLRASEILWCDGDIKDCTEVELASKTLESLSKTLGAKA